MAKLSGNVRAAAGGVSILLAVGLTSCSVSDDDSSPLELSTRDLHLEAVFGGEATTQRLKVKAVGLRVELHGNEQAPWLGLSEQPDGQDYPAILYDFWPIDTTLPGAHQAVDLRFDVFRQVDPAFERKVGSSTVHLTYDITNQIAYQEKLQPFHAVLGGASTPTQTARVIGERAGWSLSPSEPWLKVSPASGTGLADVAVGIDVEQLPTAPGEYQATLTAKGAGSTETAPLDVNVVIDAPSFSLPRQTIALTSDAGAEVEPVPVPVLDTASAGIPFSVEAGADWLTVGGDTTTGGNITIGAIGGMKPGLHSARITVRADAAHLPASVPVPVPVMLNVSLYVSAEPLVANSSLQLPHTARQPIPDPRRPYVYVIVDDRTLEGYDIETGERVASAAFSSRLGNAVISAEQDQLFVVEKGIGKVHELELPQLGEVDTFVVGSLETQLAVTRCAGRNQLWTFGDQLVAWELDVGYRLTPEGIPILNPTGVPPAILQSATGDKLFFSKSPDPDPEFMAFDVDCSNVSGSPVRMRWRATLSTELARSLQRGPQVTADGQTVCFQMCVDAKTLSPKLDLSQAGADALANRSFAQLLFGNRGGIFVADTDGHVLRFDSSWQPDGSIQAMPATSPGILPPQFELFLTGDERRLVSLDDRGVLNVWNAH